MLTDKDATQLIVPMDYQPEAGETIVSSGGNFYISRPEPQCPMLKLQPPHAIGELIPVREEWRVYETSYDKYNPYRIEYKGGGEVKFPTDVYDWRMKAKYLVSTGELFSTIGKYQPASTMPDWAAREHRRVCGVEAFQQTNTTEELMPNGCVLDIRRKGDWCWRFTLGTDWNGGSREEAEEIYERYGGDGCFEFHLDPLGIHLWRVGDMEGCLFQVEFGGTVRRDAKGVRVGRVSE